MNKMEAVKEIVFEAKRRRNSAASVKRAYRAMRLLGLNVQESLEVMGCLEYWRDYRWAREMLRSVPDFAALPECQEPIKNVAGEV